MLVRTCSLQTSCQAKKQMVRVEVEAKSIWELTEKTEVLCT